MTQPGPELAALKQVAQLMCLAARTAPKGKGVDHLAITIVEGAEKDSLAARMRKIANEADLEFFRRDADNLDGAPLVVLIGTRVGRVGVPNCGYCGYTDCEENEANNGICAFNTGDLGIAVGSAVSVAAMHHADNRVMFTAGKAAMQLGLLGDGVRIAYAIPLSGTGKNPFFDREG